METQWLSASLVVWITALAGTLDARQQVRFVALCTGLLFARGRRTVASWLRLWRGRDYKRYYYLLGSVGRKALAIAGALLRILLKRLAGDGPGTPLVFGIDDSPTKRYGPHVEGAGKHHNPTPGPAGSPFLYGHVWVCLARLVRHPLWGAIALPILSHLYIRAKDIGWMAAYYGWEFHTKLELAAAQIEWLVQQLGKDHPPIWVVTDGAYAKRPFLKRVLAAGVTVISRLRCDAALWSLPPVVDPGQKKGRGRPPKYGKQRIDLAKRAAQTRGWQTGLFSLYGRLVVKKYKTFLATYKPVGGVIRVVLVREPDRWVAYFSTDPDLSVASILETVADRSALEQVFHDVKEVHGAGQQQLRHVWANVGAWNLIGWWHTLVELWAWDRPQSRLRDRSDSPWDKPERRPSHANRCQELRREALQEEYSSLPSVAGLRQKSAGSFSASCAGSHEADSSGKVQYEDIERAFDEALDQGEPGVDFTECQTEGPRKGRQERRTCCMITNPKGIRDAGLWTGLTAIVMVISERVVNGVAGSETRCFIGSVARTAEEYLRWVRGHWGIENSLHWVLDVCFREDDQRHWAGNSAENLGWLRKLALCLLKAEKSRSSKGKSINTRRLIAGWKNDYLLTVLAQIPEKSGA